MRAKARTGTSRLHQGARGGAKRRMVIDLRAMSQAPLHSANQSTYATRVRSRGFHDGLAVSLTSPGLRARHHAATQQPARDKNRHIFGDIASGFRGYRRMTGG